jgi:hypothetical protein
MLEGKQLRGSGSMVHGSLIVGRQFGFFLVIHLQMLDRDGGVQFYFKQRRDSKPCINRRSEKITLSFLTFSFFSFRISNSLS